MDIVEGNVSTSEDAPLSDYAIQVNNILEDLIAQDDLKAIDDTLRSLEPFDNLKNIEGVQVACAVMVFHKGAYDELNEILQSVNFHPRWHSKLQRLWHEMHYKIAEQIQGKTLGAVARYRLRKKFPFPGTIWDGEKITHNIRDSSRNMMVEFYCMSEYPNFCQKEQLAKRAGLTFKQIENWFKNKRARNRSSQKKLIILEHARYAELVNQQASYSGNVENVAHEPCDTLFVQELANEESVMVGERLGAAARDSFEGELRNSESVITPEMINFGNESNIEQRIVIDDEMINREQERFEEELRNFERENLLDNQKEQNEEFSLYTLEPYGEQEFNVPEPYNPVHRNDLTTPNGLGQPPEKLFCQNMKEILYDSDPRMDLGSGFIEYSLYPDSMVQTNDVPMPVNGAEMQACPPYQDFVDEPISQMLTDEYFNEIIESFSYENEILNTSAEVSPGTSSELMVYQPPPQEQYYYNASPDFYQYQSY